MATTWLDKIDNNIFTITTGDGQKYTPLFKTGTRSKEFNTSAFHFINVKGTLVDRKQSQSAKFPLVFWFQGSDNIEQADDFERSCDDSRRWTIEHPLYGTIYGQPLSIERDDSSFNITQITIDFWESIEGEYPIVNFSIKDNTMQKRDELSKVTALNYSSKQEVFEAVDVNTLKENNINMAAAMEPIVKNKVTVGSQVYATYVNVLAGAQKAANGLTDTAFDAIRNAQSLLELPCVLATDVSVRLNGFKIAYEKLVGIYTTVSDKNYFETMACTCLSSFCVSIVNPIDGDFKTMKSIEYASSLLKALYDNYLATLDSQTVNIAAGVTAWKADSLTQRLMKELIDYTLANLYALSFEAKRERIVYTTSETNAILLVHRYIGLDANDKNIEDFLELNDIKLLELFSIKKEREIKYFR